ncbi:Partner of Y14 and mago [Psilocybe cubensis]|uniref:Partner of Y14 and mago n=2 Tax=Psilocybe cubensis TaxID=181762 RepID=A0ACB8H557_PSICU|nr:Partner of Y14 and mago [Psilocybe cubensis]KAH9482908.1 Partner of Y14 and mago [Psilocybe cubensis]
MSRPPLNPEKTVAGITVDPQTLERVIPESRRPDGTVRKQIKIRPGFTPQEDVRRFRGTKQAQMDANALPKGHIIGWAPPPTSTAASNSAGKPLSKSAKKNLKRKEKREKEKEDKADVPENWDDDDDDKPTPTTTKESANAEKPAATTTERTSSTPDATAELSNKLEKLDVK